MKKLYYILSIIFLMGCNAGEPKVVNGFVFYNHSGKKVELLHSLPYNKITDEYVYDYSRPYYLTPRGVKMPNYRTIIKPDSLCNIAMIGNWKKVIKNIFNNKLPISILSTDSLNSIISLQKGLKVKCLLEYIEIDMDSLRKNNYEIHYYGSK
jgi:hypothetical protein